MEEAGGRVTTMNGCAFSVFDRTLLAANDALWAGVKAETAKSVTRLVEEGQDLSPWFIPEVRPTISLPRFSPAKRMKTLELIFLNISTPVYIQRYNDAHLFITQSQEYHL